MLHLYSHHRGQIHIFPQVELSNDWDAVAHFWAGKNTVVRAGCHVLTASPGKPFFICKSSSILISEKHKQRSAVKTQAVPLHHGKHSFVDQRHLSVYQGLSLAHKTTSWVCKVCPVCGVCGVVSMWCVECVLSVCVCLCVLSVCVFHFSSTLC